MHEEFDLVLRIEFDRAKKLRRPLAALALIRGDTGSAPLSSEHVAEANAAIGRCTRAFDAADLVTARVILIVLPETDASGVRVVANRLRADLAAQHDGQRPWIILEFPNVQQYGGPDHLLETARRIRPGGESLVA